MTKPPAGSSLLFGALADSGQIKQRKNGSYRMVLEGVDEIDWFTDRPERVAGEWSPKKLLKEWDVLFSDDEPNAQMSYTWTTYMDFVGAMKGRGNMSFEMFKPKLADSNQTLSFKVRGIGKKNKDLLTGLSNKQLSDASLFIDGSFPSCLPNCQGANLTGANLIDAYLEGANFSGANLSKANLTGARLKGANLVRANLSQANLVRAKLVSANLERANLSYANLISANLIRARLGGSNLSKADLSNAHLNDATLFLANLTGARLKGATLDGAKWKLTTCPDGTWTGGGPCTAEQLIPA